MLSPPLALVFILLSVQFPGPWPWVPFFSIRFQLKDWLKLIYICVGRIKLEMIHFEKIIRSVGIECPLVHKSAEASVRAETVFPLGATSVMWTYAIRSLLLRPGPTGEMIENYFHMQGSFASVNNCPVPFVRETPAWLWSQHSCYACD